jgi:hypothetical protein
MPDPKIPVMPGLNAWRFIRTDRDGASRDEILNMVGPIMAFCLSEAMTSGPQEKVIKTGELQWRAGAARPIVALDASRDLIALPAGKVIADRKYALPDRIPTVRGSAPWYVTLSFWWRADQREITYPAQVVSALGLASHGELGSSSDWLLDQAVVPVAADADPGDQTWGDVVSGQALATVKQVGAFVGNTLAVVAVVALGGALVYFLATRSGK